MAVSVAIPPATDTALSVTVCNHVDLGRPRLLAIVETVGLQVPGMNTQSLNASPEGLLAKSARKSNCCL